MIRRKNTRLIARLDVKGPNLIKGVHLEGLRVIGDPQTFAENYYRQGADEIVYMDIVASLYGRSNLREIVFKTSNNIFVPLTVGGGIRSLDDIADLLNAGADKVAINTAAVERPALISEASQRYGSQCVVLSIEAKLRSEGCWEVYTDCGRQSTGLDVIEWAIEGESLGAGEILLTSIDREGTGRGFDKKLISAVTSSVSVPVIVSGGYGNKQDLGDAVNSNADGVAFARALHYGLTTFQELRDTAREYDIPVREIL